MSMEGVNNRNSVQLGQNQNVQGGVGQLGDHQVEVGQPRPRADSAMKNFLLDVQKFFTSLFGIKVSPSKPEHINSQQDGIKAVISDFARKDFDSLEAMKSLGALHDRSNLQSPEMRDRDGSPKVEGFFREEVGRMSDLQLLRLHSNLSRHPELAGIAAYAGAIAMEHIDIPTQDQMIAGGKLGDMGWLVDALRGDVVAELAERGFNTTDIPTAVEHPPTPEITGLTLRSIRNGGDVGKAVDDMRRDILNARLEASGLPRVGEGGPPQVQHDPDRIDAINANLKGSGLPEVR